MKTLIINGSPRKSGDTSSLVSVMKQALEGEVIELSPYHDNISPCFDCRYCWKKGKCAIEDDMELIYNDDYENLVVASPVYISHLTGPTINLVSRLQVYYAAKKILKQEIVLREKKGILMLVGGGDGAPNMAINYASGVFKRLNVSFDDMVLSLNTDRVPAIQDENAVQKVKQIAYKLNSGE